VLKVICVCGARPNFIKIAPLVKSFQDTKAIETLLVHTGQHYDERMSEQFFRELEIPKPDIDLEVGSASHAVQTAEIMKRFEPLCLTHSPNWVVVVGDVNSTIACALVAVKLGIRVAHVEAGLRSFDRTMPEEINRVLTDAISSLLFVTEPAAIKNLSAEGITGNKVQFVGNVMIDTLLANRDRAEQSDVLQRMGLADQGYVLVTLHRPSNVDSPETFSSILEALIRISLTQPVIFPIHPRSRKNVATFGFEDRLAAASNLRLIEPQGYLDFLKLMTHARLVMTDSGGMQEETTILSVPCITLRRNTERPITITQGTNQLVDPDHDAILKAFDEATIHEATIHEVTTHEVIKSPSIPAKQPDLWDGQAATRIAHALLRDEECRMKNAE